VSTVIRITLYGRADCELCHEMRDVVDAVGRELGFEVEEIDVDEDATLTAAYGSDVPVLLVNGREAFRHRVSAAALRARLAAEPA
jgi:glutaredoxin